MAFTLPQTTMRRRMSYGGGPPPLDHVADANERLSIDPTGKTAGYQVIQDDGPTTYEFIGDGTDSDAGLMVDGTLPCSVRGQESSKNYYNRVGVSDSLVNNVVYWTGSQWYIVMFGSNVDSTGEDVEFPWLPTWSIAVVTRNPIASEANWTVV